MRALWNLFSLDRGKDVFLRGGSGINGTRDDVVINVDELKVGNVRGDNYDKADNEVLKNVSTNPNNGFSVHDEAGGVSDSDYDNYESTEHVLIPMKRTRNSTMEHSTPQRA